MVVDSIKRSGIIGTDNNGGNLDAFKHTYWMASLSVEIGKKQALKLGRAHEKGNYLQYKKHLLEETLLPDSVSSEMDLRNNEVGANSGSTCLSISEKDLQDLILEKLRSGGLYIIRKDSEGNYMNCKGSVIEMHNWAGKWNIPKCIVQSNNH